MTSPEEPDFNRDNVPEEPIQPENEPKQPTPDETDEIRVAVDALFRPHKASDAKLPGQRRPTQDS